MRGEGATAVKMGVWKGGSPMHMCPLGVHEYYMKRSVLMFMPCNSDTTIIL